VGGSCEHGNKPSGSTKCWDILVWPSDCPFRSLVTISTELFRFRGIAELG
jgi:hypothetical protein